MARRPGNQRKDQQNARSSTDGAQLDDPGRVAGEALGELDDASDEATLASLDIDAAEEDSDAEAGVEEGDALVIEGATVIIEGGTVIIEGGTVTITGPLQMEGEGDEAEEGLDIDRLIEEAHQYDGRANSQARPSSGSRRNRS